MFKQQKGKMDRFLEGLANGITSNKTGFIIEVRNRFGINFQHLQICIKLFRITIESPNQERDPRRGNIVTGASNPASRAAQSPDVSLEVEFRASAEAVDPNRLRTPS